MFGTIASLLFGGAKDVISKWQENSAKEAQAKVDLKVAYLQNKTRLMLSDSEANHSWEMAALANSNASLKWGSFILFAGPIFLTFFMPMFGAGSVVRECWNALNMVPEYWRYGFTAMTGSIWGVACLKDMGGIKSIVAGFAPKQAQAPVPAAPRDPGARQRPSALPPAQAPAPAPAGTGLGTLREIADAAPKDLGILIDKLTK